MTTYTVRTAPASSSTGSSSRHGGGGTDTQRKGCKVRKAFSLLEMLVVIGIIGLLMSVLVVHISGGTESARASQCLANMSSLAKGCSQYAASSWHWPTAGSAERLSFDESSGIANARELYDEHPGWISWDSAGAYSRKPSSHIANLSWFTSSYETDAAKREYALTNGCLWRFVAGQASCYRCPEHLIKMARLGQKTMPNWSYVMNSYFGWDESLGSQAKDSKWEGQRFEYLKRAERRLLFAELKWEPWVGGDPSFSSSPGIDNDAILQYDPADGGECIAWNHKSGRDKVAHVVFADGHTERLSLPKAGLSASEAKHLTQWLCAGSDISFDGKKYRELK